ncbi:MAG: glycoside hydrolase family 3 C-terminal domain-containing protein, partial [Oscillospiraceae bacterium]|nr:glycoside hydrolase family 3 C-terminal domain-containing protein [Oscillospiraceae bacterium]
ANAKAAAEAAAAAADVCVYVITRVAGEDGDLNATTYQVQPKELLVYYEYETAFKNAGKPIIALINVGGTMSTTMIRGGYVSVGTGANNVVRTTTGANAIMDVWNPGTAGNEAIADILRGAVNPSGRLAQTFIVNFEDSPSIKMFTDYNNRTDKATFPTYPGNGYNNNAYYADGVYVGHRYFESNPESYASMVAFPFGYGLSYTTFEFSNLTLDKKVFYADTDKLSATVTVKNTGNVAGKEVVQLYLGADTWQEEGRPKNELRAYGKTDMLQPGQSQTITLSITLNDLQYYDDGTPDSFIGHPETRAFWSTSNPPIYGRGVGWTVADDTGFTVTIRTNGSDGSLPNQPIDGLKDHFVYSAEIPVKAFIRADAGTVGINNPASYTISLSDAVGAGVVTLSFTADSRYLDLNNATALNGFTILEPLAWEYIGSQIWKGTVKLYCPGFVQNNDPLDVLKISGSTLNLLGATTVTLTDITVSGDLHGVSGSKPGLIVTADASISIVSKTVFSKYDLNHDEKIDELDLAIVVYYYLANDLESDWEVVKFDIASAKDCDVALNGRVDLADMIEVIANYCDSY